MSGFITPRVMTKRSHHFWKSRAISEVQITGSRGKPYEMTESALAGQSTQKSIHKVKNTYHRVMLYVYGLTKLINVATLSRLGADHMAFPGRESAGRGH